MRAPLALLLLATVGCGSSGSSGTGGSGGGQTGGSGGAPAPDAAAGAGGQIGGQGGAPADASVDQAPADAGPDGGAPTEECRKDSDCPPIQCLVPPCDPVVCVLGESGHHCQLHTPPAPAACPDPNPDPGLVCCRTHAECTMQPHGQCIPHNYNYCAGPPPLPGGSCQYDACSGDADCTAMPNGFCTATFPRWCLYGPCRTDADCGKGPGGRCVMATLSSGYCPRPVVFCRYANDPCRSDADCRGGSLNGLACSPRADLHGTMCVDRGPPPP